MITSRPKIVCEAHQAIFVTAPNTERQPRSEAGCLECGASLAIDCGAHARACRLQPLHSSRRRVSHKADSRPPTAGVGLARGLRVAASRHSSPLALLSSPKLVAVVHPSRHCDHRASARACIPVSACCLRDALRLTLEQSRPTDAGHHVKRPHRRPPKARNPHDHNGHRTRHRVRCPRRLARGHHALL
jgi:hypothetical protein